MRRSLQSMLCVLGLVVMSCHQESDRNPVAPAPASPEAVTADARGGGPKESVCHYDRIQDIHFPVVVSTSSVPKHLEHGDWLVAAEACGDDIDNDCDGTADEDCPDCGEVDTDEDGVFDLCDNCPADANAGQEDTDNNGVGDACDFGQGVGTLAVTLEWDNVNDMDLWVEEPNGEVIYWNNKGPSATGGVLDFDSNVDCVDQQELENVSWPDGSPPDTGDYLVTVDEYEDCVGDSSWTATVRVDGVVKLVVNGTGPGTFSFTLAGDGTVTQLAPLTATSEMAFRRPSSKG